MKVFSGIALSLFLLCVSAQDYFKSVLVVDDSTFHSTIYNKESKYTLMNFYSTDCTHCNALGPQYTILAELFKDNKKIQIAQIEGKTNRKTRMKEKIIGFPCIRLYAFDGTHVASYVGERQADAMADWITDNTGARAAYPAKTVVGVQGSEEVLTLLKDRKRKMVAFVAPWLEDWKQKITQFEKSSWDYVDDITFYEVDLTIEENSEVLSLLKITSYPTLMYFPGEDLYFRVITDKGLNEKKIRWFIDDDTLGETYYGIEQYMEEQADIEEETNDEEAPKGYGMHQNHGKFDNVDEEEMYKRLREL